MESSSTPYSSLIVELFNAGWEILFDLGYMNGCGGISEFTLFPSPDEDSEQRYAWRASAQFLRRLDSETQNFVFSAVLACELLRATHGAVKSEVSGNHFERLRDSSTDENATQDYEDDVKTRFIQLLSESATDNEVLLNVLEKSSACYQKDYFENNRSGEAEDAVLVNSSPRDEGVAETLVERFREVIKEEMKDLDFGIRTAIDYFSKHYLDGQEEASRYEPFLRKELGEELYGQLDFLARRALQLGEMNYQKNKEPDGYNSCVISFCAAYEIEFYLRIIQPIASDLLKQGVRDYPADRTRRSPILFNRQINDRLSVGDFIHHLTNDGQLGRHFPTGLSEERIIQGAKNFRSLRNPVSHRRLADRSYANRVRDLVLGRESILKDLIRI